MEIKKLRLELGEAVEIIGEGNYGIEVIINQKTGGMEVEGLCGFTGVRYSLDHKEDGGSKTEGRGPFRMVISPVRR